MMLVIMTNQIQLRNENLGFHQIKYSGETRCSLNSDEGVCFGMELWSFIVACYSKVTGYYDPIFTTLFNYCFCFWVLVLVLVFKMMTQCATQASLKLGDSSALLS